MKNPDTFVHIEHPVVRTYNRAITALSLLEEHGEASIREYFQQFSEGDRLAIAAMLIDIKRNPESTTKRVQGYVVD